MLAYTSVGTNDMEAARKFYDALFSEMGAGVLFERPDGGFVSYGFPGQPMFGVCKPWDGEKATIGNGVMISIAAKDPAQAKALYDKAIELGGTCEGEPGPRLNGAFTCAYVRDLDGNKLNFFCMGS